MFVNAAGTLGTIGGGKLEHLAVGMARDALAQGLVAAEIDVPLGPEIRQCCGGRVRLAITPLDEAGKADAIARAESAKRIEPTAYVFGAGHVGRALAAALSLLPLRTVLIDSRAEQLALAPAGIETRLTRQPEHEVASAPPKSAFIVLTHEHALDFLVARLALARGDAAYVGMIGSATKRAQVERWLRTDGPAGADPTKLICPIGAQGADDKRPAVIAAHVAVEVLASFTAGQDIAVATRSARAGSPRATAEG